MHDDVLINKAQIIKRCINRINQEFDLETFNEDYTRQDSVILNIQRACEACIDMANRIIRMKKLEFPQSTRDCFEILAANNFICDDLKTKMQNMVGFRNIAVHDYQKLSIEITKKVVTKHLKDFKDFVEIILKI